MVKNGGGGRIEKELFWGLVYVQNRPNTEIDVLLETVRQQMKQSTRRSIRPPVGGGDEGFEAEGDRADTSSRSFISTDSTSFTSTNKVSSLGGSASSVASSVASSDDMAEAFMGRSDRFGGFYGVLSLRDSLIFYCLLLNGVLIYQLFWKSFYGSDLRLWPENWSQVGSLLFGMIICVHSILGFISSWKPALNIIHYFETLTIALSSALAVDGFIQFISIILVLVQDIKNPQPLLTLLIVLALRVLPVLVNFLFFIGIIRSYRSVVVTGGKGTEKLPWFSFIKLES